MSNHNRPPIPRTISQEIAAQLPTMPAPAATPRVRDARVEPESPLATKASAIIVGDLRAVVSASSAPKADAAAALEQLAATLREELRVSAARSSQENLEQDARVALELVAANTLIKEHDERIMRIETSSRNAASSAGAVEKLLSGVFPPKVVLGFVAVWSAIQAVIQIIATIRGHQ